MATVLTNVGEQWVAERMAGSGTYSTATGQYIGWGTGAGTAVKGSTTLFTEATEARATGTVSVTGSTSTAKWQVVGTITADGTKTITNAGVFSASSSGGLFIHYDFTGVALNAGDSIQFTFTADPA